MTVRRSLADLTRRRELADASISDVPIPTSLVHRRFPALRRRNQELAASLGEPTELQIHVARRRRDRDLLASAIEPPSGFVVATYALGMLPHEPRATLSRLQAFALHQGWRVYGRGFWDCDCTPYPLDRTGWREIERLMVAGFVHGVVTSDEAAVSSDSTECERVRDRFESRRTFLTHVPDNWHQTGPATREAHDDR
ncbi:hypothetical protein ABZY93_21915 [Streptomyces smyrnaeus]|uniref:hypothetical protein n=1 Tax=Streptomyces smyrnaeus TaxID=1387713 RepID=UPI0033B36B0F